MQLFGQSGAVLSDAHDVVARILILYLGGPGKAVNGVVKGVLGLRHLFGEGFQEQGLHDQALEDGGLVGGNL